MPRLFTALEIPRDAALSLSLLRGGLPGARWIDVENYHLTLRFIGDIEGHVADEIANALDRQKQSLESARQEAAMVATATARTNMVERAYKDVRRRDERERSDRERLDLIAQKREQE
ncbi:MAG: hypothetical protein E5V92_23610 [Mesorhizobium sp.]|nr:MAG: hypothetical protein E5V92_23610 [Mesorhizobium sp.]